MATTQGIRAGKAFVEIGGDDSRLLRALRRAQVRLKAFGDGVRSVGQRLVATAAVIGTPFALSSIAFATFEQSMARVRALTNANEKDFKRLSDEAKRLGETTVFSASQAADAMGFFALAGFSVEQILKSIGPTLNLAAAGQLEIAQSADIAAKIMAGMGIEADRLGEAVDVLTKAMTTANTDLLQLGDAMKFVGPIAKSAGIAFEEIVAAIQLLSNAGIQGEMAGTTLRGAILALTSPSKEAADTLKELGVNVLDAQGNVRPLAAIIADLNRAMEGMGSGKRLEILGRIFQARQAAGVAELLSQGADKLRDYQNALQGATGTAERIAGVQLNTLKGQAIILKSALEGLGIAVGESIVAPLRIVTHLITRVTTAIAQWVRENRMLVVVAAGSVAVLGAVGVALVLVGASAQAAAFVLGGLASVLVAVKVAFAAAAAIIGAVISPIGLLIAAVTVLGGTVIAWSGAGGKALQWLRDRFGELSKFVGSVVSGIRDALAAGDIALAARVLWAGLRVAWEQGIQPLRQAWIGFSAGFQRAAIIAFSGVRKAWIEVRDWFERNFPDFTAGIAKGWANLAAGVQRIWARVTNWLADRFTEVMGLLDETLDVEGAKALNRRELDADLAGIESQRKDAIAEAERRRGRSDAQREQEKEAALNAVDAQRAEALADLDEQTAERIRQAEEALARTKQELAQAVDTARQQREDALASGQDPASAALQRLADLGDQLDLLASRVSVRGTFDASAVRGLAAGDDSAERTARATEQTARHTKRLVEASTKGLAFG